MAHVRKRHMAHLSLVTIGVLLLGIGSYALQFAVNRTATATDVAAFGSFWALTFGLVAGILLPFEQLMVRATAGTPPPGEDSHSRGISERRVVKLYLGVALIVFIALVSLAGPIGDRLLNGQHGLAYILALYVGPAFAQSYQRGRAAGLRRLDIYGRQLALDGSTRMLLGIAILVSGGTSPLLAGAGVSISAIASLAFASLPRRSEIDPPKVALSMLGLFREALLMSSASTLSVWLLNAGVVVVIAFGADAHVAAAFTAIFIITRIPLLFQSSLQSVVLATVVEHRQKGDHAAVRRSIGLSVAAISTMGILIIIVFGVLADQWSGLLYGARYQLGLTASIGLALSTALFLVAAVCHVSLLGLNASQPASIAWFAAVLTFSLVSWVNSTEPVLAVVFGYVAGGVVLIVVQATFILRRLTSAELGGAAHELS